MEKLTNSKALEMVLNIQEVKDNSDLTKKLEKMKEQFDKKNGKDKDRKPTKAQEENENLKIEIMAILEECDKPKSIKDLQKENEVIGVDKYSNQKISALMRQLIKEEIVTRIEEKRVALFSIKRVDEIVEPVV